MLNNVTQQQVDDLNRALEAGGLPKGVTLDLDRQETDVAEMSRVILKPGDTLVVKIKSDNVDTETLEKFKSSFKQKFPDNTILVLLMSPGDDIELSTIGKE